MPELDLGPDDYRRQTRSGRWETPDDPRSLWIGLIFDIAALAFLFWNRAQFASSVEVLFGLVALFAGSGGMLAVLIVKLRSR